MINKIVITPDYWPLHYGKFRGTRQTFILEPKISSFVEIFGLFVQLDMYTAYSSP